MKLIKNLVPILLMVFSQNGSASTYGVICSLWLGAEKDGEVLGYDFMHEVVESTVNLDNCNKNASSCVADLNYITNAGISELPSFDMKLKVYQSARLVVQEYGNLQFDDSKMDWYGQLIFSSNGNQLAALTLASKFDVDSSESILGSDVSILSLRDPLNSNYYLIQCFNAFSVRPIIFNF